MANDEDNSLPSIDLTGVKVGDYLVIRRLGRGGMADVYLARQSSLDRNVALKVLRPELAENADYVRRFNREARAAAALVHSNIVQIFEVGQHDDIHFIAQEYIPGRNLKQYLVRNGAVDPKLAMEIIAGTAQALRKSDEFKVVHRDIKPENIMLSEAEEVKVTDFGLARINDDPNGQTLTKVGITMGTPLYMSPEQVEGKPLDVRSDIYSLGVTAYHMLAGAPPFEGDNPLTIAVQQVKNEAAQLHESRPDLPQDLCDLIHEMIDKNPQQRPQDADAILQRLKQINLAEDYHLANANFNISQRPITNAKKQNSRTWRLQAAMKGSLKGQYSKRWLALLGILGLGIAAWFGGSYLASAYAPEDPLAFKKPTQPPVLPALDTIEDQYEIVYWEIYERSSSRDLLYEEALWKRVIEKFPLETAGDAINKTQHYHNRTKARLGELYLSFQEYEKAEPIYQELSKLGDLDRRFRVTGSIGLAKVIAEKSPNEFDDGIQEQEESIRRLLSGLDGEDRDLLEPIMQRYYDQLQSRFQSFAFEDEL